jgi:hypothetical protein
MEFNEMDKNFNFNVQRCTLMYMTESEKIVRKIEKEIEDEREKLYGKKKGATSPYPVSSPSSSGIHPELSG